MNGMSALESKMKPHSVGAEEFTGMIWKTATGCESNKQLQLRPGFAGTVVNNYLFNGFQG